MRIRSKLGISSAMPPRPYLSLRRQVPQAPAPGRFHRSARCSTSSPSMLPATSSFTPTSPGGADTVTETLVTPSGDYAFPDAFDAYAIVAAGAVAVPLADDYDIV